jgi:hypothetical protein
MNNLHKIFITNFNVIKSNIGNGHETTLISKMIEIEYLWFFYKRKVNSTLTNEGKKLVEKYADKILVDVFYKKPIITETPIHYQSLE